MEWKTSRELLEEMQASYKRLRTGKITVSQARAEADYFKGMAKHLSGEVAHAKVTGRLVEGSDYLPGYRLTEEAPRSAARVAKKPATKARRKR